MLGRLARLWACLPVRLIAFDDLRLFTRPRHSTRLPFTFLDFPSTQSQIPSSLDNHTAFNVSAPRPPYRCPYCQGKLFELEDHSSKSVVYISRPVFPLPEENSTSYSYPYLSLLLLVILKSSRLTTNPTIQPCRSLLSLLHLLNSALPMPRVLRLHKSRHCRKV
jgi:hypothetical protein